MRDAVYQVNKANGWFDDDRSAGTDLALLHSEVSEMFEAYRDHGLEDVTLKLCKVFDHSHPTPVGHPHRCKPEGFGSEAADVLVRYLDTMYRTEEVLIWGSLHDVEMHPDFAWSAEVGDHIAYLHRLIAQGRLNQVIRYLKTWTDMLGIDLQFEFDRKVAYNATRGHKHGGKRV